MLQLSFFRYFVLNALLSAMSLALADGGGYALRAVSAGESLGSIANRYNISVNTLMEFNEFESATIYPGDIIRVPFSDATGGFIEAAPTPPPGFRLHVLAPGETISSVMEAYDLSLEALVGANPDISSLDRLPVGLELLIPPAAGLVITLEEGQSVLDLIKTYNVSPVDLVKVNQLESPEDLQPGTMVFLPGVRPIQVLERLAKVRELENTYIWPVSGRITSYFGRRNLGLGTSGFHRGLDIALPQGQSVVAARSGTVSFAGYQGNYGYLVKISHPGGTETRYAHNSRLLVSPGQYVRQGEVIALVGSTGLSTGPHVHFEIREQGTAIDPLSYLR